MVDPVRVVISPPITTDSRFASSLTERVLERVAAPVTPNVLEKAPVVKLAPLELLMISVVPTLKDAADQ